MNSVMTSRDVMEHNQGSWSGLLETLQLMPDFWPDWKPFVKRVLQCGIDAGWDKHFRAGQAFDQILFSTCEQHGFERFSPPPARVTLARYQGQYSVAYSHIDVRNSPAERRDFVTSTTVLPVLRSYLVALWRETRPTEPEPELNAT